MAQYMEQLIIHRSYDYYIRKYDNKQNLYTHRYHYNVKTDFCLESAHIPISHYFKNIHKKNIIFYKKCYKSYFDGAIMRGRA